MIIMSNVFQSKKSKIVRCLMPVVGGGMVGLLPSIGMANVEEEQGSRYHMVLDEIVVTAVPLQPQAKEMATATSIITSDELAQKTASTLGDILANEVGVSSDTFGQGASRPIIRGQTAPRVKVVQNGLTVQDASQISPDHQVSVPVSGAKQIEVVKGTSALMYGGGAIGGVVNVVDNTIQQKQPISQVNGKVTVVGQQATDGYLAYGELVGSIGDNWVWSTSYQKTDQGNIQVPHWDTDEISNSWYTQDNGSVGLSYLFDNGDYVGASYQRQTSEYGLPFHVHSNCQPDRLNPNQLFCEELPPHTHTQPPYVDLTSNVYQIHGEKQMPMTGVDKVAAKLSYTDYQHDEIENFQAGTTFSNKALVGKLDATHATFKTGNLGFMKGIVGLDINHSKFAADGTEGFLPKTNNSQVGLYFIERLTPTYFAAKIDQKDKFANNNQQDTHDHSGHSHGGIVPQNKMNLPANKSPWYVEFGARQEFQNTTNTKDNIKKSYAGSSFSVEGGKYLTPSTQLSARISHSERLPTAQELFANGAHFATNAWERGDVNLKKEQTNGIELTYRYDNGNNFDASISAFYNDSKDYIYAKTQDIASPEDAPEAVGFSLIDYTQTDAKHYGGELKTRYYLNDNISVGGFADIAIIKLDDPSLRHKYAPRLAAPRVGGDITVQFGQFDASLSGYHRFEQDKIADFETVTPSYNMLNAKLTYNSSNQYDYSAFIQVSNILNELAYNHSSYLVEHVPMPERSVNAGITYRF